MKSLKGKIVLVTGAASGIGKEVAVRFAGEGSDLVLADIDEAGLRDTTGRIESQGRKVLPVRADVSRREEVEELSRRALAEFGRVDVLVNNAGVCLVAEIKDIELEEWEWILGINLWGTIHTLHYLLPQMIERRSGHVVNISSSVGLVGYPTVGAYCASKYALVGLTEVLRTELERFGIGVTAVCPGGVKTPIFENMKVKGFRKDATVPSDFVVGSLERAAKKIVRAVKKDQAFLVFTAFAIATYGIKRFSPALTRQLNRAFLKRLLKETI